MERTKENIAPKRRGKKKKKRIDIKGKRSSTKLVGHGENLKRAGSISIPNWLTFRKIVTTLGFFFQ